MEWYVKCVDIGWEGNKQTRGIIRSRGVEGCTSASEKRARITATTCVVDVWVGVYTGGCGEGMAIGIQAWVWVVANAAVNGR